MKWMCLGGLALLAGAAACGGGGEESDASSMPSMGTQGGATAPGGGSGGAPPAQPAAGVTAAGMSGGTAPAGAGAAAGSGGSVAPPSGSAGDDEPNPPAAQDGGAGPDAGGTDAGAEPPGPATGTFPPIEDPWDPGPFATTTMSGAGPDRNATVFHPRELGKDGLEHPIVVWDNGNTVMGPSIYQPLLTHLASHGFAVYAAYVASDGGAEIKAGLDWMIAENDRMGSAFYQKLDPTKTAAMGHSQGSLATFAQAGDPRITTTIHLSGGTNPDLAAGHSTLANLHNPAAFICGEPGGDGLIVGDVASEWCAYDFEHATVPVFLAQITGASHISAPGMTSGACAGWLRWQLMADTTMKRLFVGPDCELCTRRNWVVKQKDLM